IGIGVELTAPVGVRKQRNRMWTTAGLVRGEQASLGRPHAEDLKEVSDHIDAGGGLRVAAACQAQIVGGNEGLVSGYGLGGQTLVPELFVGVGGVGSAGKAATGRWRRNPNQFVRIRKRQRTQKEGVDETEDRGVGADAERQNDQRNDRKGSIFAESAQGVAQVLRHFIEQAEAAGVAVLLARPGGTAELDQSLPAGLRGCEAAP